MRLDLVDVIICIRLMQQLLLAKIDKELEDFENDDDVPIDYLTDALDPISRSRHTQASRMSSSTASRRGKIISNIDGETIRMLDPRGIRILDDFLSDPRVDTNDAVARYINLVPLPRASD